MATSGDFKLAIDSKLPWLYEQYLLIPSGNGSPQMTTDWYAIIGDCELLSDAHKGSPKSGPLISNIEGISWNTRREPELFRWSDITKVEAAFNNGQGRITIFKPTPSGFLSKKVTEAQQKILLQIAEATEAGIVGVKTQRKEFLKAYIVDGSGWAPQIGTLTSIQILESSIELRAAQETVRVEFADLIDVDVKGFSQTTNAGFIGGGFGFKGAAEGILAARLVNQLTSKTKQWVVVQILGNSGSAQLFIPDTSDFPIRHFFRPVQDGIIVARATSPSQSTGAISSESSNHLVSSLERLTMLYEKGLLNDEEFLAAKAKVLGGQ